MRKSASRLARCLVRVKTSALFISPRLMSSRRREDFTSWATGFTGWVMPTAGAAVRSRLMVAGWRSSSRVRATMGGGMVAEKNSVWLRGGRCLSTRRISGRKPMSSMRSASSSTRISSPPSLA